MAYPPYSTPAPPPLMHDSDAARLTATSTGELGRALTVGTAAFFFSICALGITAVLTPRYMDIFRDFGVALPLLTRGFLALGRALTTPVGLLIAGASVFVITGVAGALAGRGRRSAVLLHMLIIALFIIYLGAFLASMQLPLATMINATQQNAPAP